MYTTRNFKTKKELKEALTRGEKLTVWQPGPFGSGAETRDAVCSVEGPHYPQPHRWYARVTLREGIIIKVE